jgi:hypothetical protein
MSRSRLASILAAPILSFLLVLAAASPAAAVTFEQKVAALDSFTQTSVGSYNTWLSARNNQAAWADYAFDWSTDYCSDSPDNPLGFDFKLSCARHDFGYRNYKRLSLFTSTTKARVDSALYEDLKRKCATYNVFVRPACYSLAWTYYQAVKTFGSFRITQAEMDKAAALKAEGLAQQAHRCDDSTMVVG